MFDHLLGNLQNSQEEIKKKLETIIVENSIQEGAIIVKMNGAKEIQDLIIDKEKLDLTDSEQVQDLLIEVINQAIVKATEKEQEISQGFIKNIMPPGMENLFGS